MRIPDSEYVPLAPSHNGSVRENHESTSCSGGRECMIIEKTDEYIRAYCFRCGGRGYHPLTRHYGASSRTTARPSGGGDVSGTRVGQAGNHPPTDATTEYSSWPASPRGWLSEAGITPSQGEALGIQWSDSQGALWLPVRQDRHVNGWIKRKFNPKFVRNETECHEKFWGWIPSASGSRTLVLVEDWLSAVRVSKFCPVIAMMGTELKADCLRWIAEHSSMFDEVVIFLDADNTIVRMKARKIAQRISFLRTRNIEAFKDPKHLSDDELERVLCV